MHASSVGGSAGSTAVLPAPPAKASLGLVICTAGRPHCVERLLGAVATQSRVPDEVLIVDGSRAPEAAATEAAVAKAPVAARYVLVEAEGRGLTRQRNRGIAEISTEVIAFLDDDTVPSMDYFADLEEALANRPDVVGVGGWIDDGLWCDAAGGAVDGTSNASLASLARFEGGHVRVGSQRRALGARWRLRRRLGLAPPFEPGRIPPEGHGWPVSFVPPGGPAVKVDCLMGGASAWRRSLFEKVQFSPWFDGYGLYEDQDFSIRAGRFGTLVLLPSAQLAHLHEPSARPRAVHYGRMVVRNGWRVWRTGNPSPGAQARLRWWLVTLLLLCVRISNAVTGPSRQQALAEAWGRTVGVIEVVLFGVPLEGTAEGEAR